MEYLEKVTDSIYAHTKGDTIGNVGVIAGDLGNYIIDTSMYPVIARDLRNELQEIKSGKVLGALLTHYHFDHSGGNQYFHPHIHAHKHVLENMKKNYDQEKMNSAFDDREDSQFFEGLEVTFPTKVFETNPYHPDDSDQIEIHQVGGHTNGSSLIYYKAENTVFAGDDLFAERFPWGGDPTASPYDWLKAIDLLKNWSPDFIIPGHGPLQYNLGEVTLFGTYLKQVIATGEKLKADKVSTEEAVGTLMEIDSNPEKSEGMKQRTLQHWYTLM